MLSGFHDNGAFHRRVDRAMAGRDPGLSDVCIKETPVSSPGEVNRTGDPASDTTVCGARSSLVQVTVVPVLTVSIAGLKAKFLIAIVCGEPEGTGAIPAG